MAGSVRPLGLEGVGVGRGAEGVGRGAEGVGRGTASSGMGVRRLLVDACRDTPSIETGDMTCGMSIDDDMGVFVVVGAGVELGARERLPGSSLSAVSMPQSREPRESALMRDAVERWRVRAGAGPAGSAGAIVGRGVRERERA
jgi:hypothetical protein